MKLIQKMNLAEIRMLLNFLGIKLSEQPGTTKELKALLNAFKNDNIELYREAYDFVVNQKPPAQATEKVIGVEDARNLISGEIQIIKDGALSQLENTFKKKGEKVLTDITEAFSKAVEIESKKFNTVKHIVYTGKKKTKEIDGVVCEEFETLLQLAKERINILMVGPSGCGKTHVSAQIAEAMNLDFASQSCSSGVSESVFTGKLLPLGDHGKFEYVESDFVRIYENGGVFLFDELDACDANVLVFLNQSLANGSFHCAQRIGKTLVQKHKDFVAVGASNTFGQGADSLYTGRNSLDAATLDRFRMGTIVLDYSSQVEEKLIDPEILEFGREIRKRISTHNLKKILSTRFMKDATTMKIGQKWSMEKIQDMYFADWSREEIAVIGGKLKFENEPDEKESKHKNSDDMKQAVIDILEDLGGKEWTGDGDSHRMYFNSGGYGGPSFYYDLKNRMFVNKNCSYEDFNKCVEEIQKKLRTL